MIVVIRETQSCDKASNLSCVVHHGMISASIVIFFALLNKRKFHILERDPMPTAYPALPLSTCDMCIVALLFSVQL